MLLAAYCLGLYGFLRAGEFTTLRSFDPSTHVAVSDVQADTLVNPTCFKIRIKYSKTKPFRMACDIYVGCGSGSICPVPAIGHFPALRGAASGPLCRYADGRPLSWQQLSSSVLSYTRQVTLARILIKTLAQWSSDAYQLYICTPTCSLTQLSSQLPKQEGERAFF